MKPITVAPASRLSSGDASEENRYTFYFDVDSTSGALLFLPLSDFGYLDAVRWAPHREPETHIEETAVKIVEYWQSLNHVAKQAKIVGLTVKDRSLVESIQAKLKSTCDSAIMWPTSHPLEALERLSEERETANKADIDILICRHLLEHSRNIHESVKKLCHLLPSYGLCLIETPDSTDLYDHGDLSQLWEEHCIYFTKTQLIRTLEASGFEIISTYHTLSEGERILIVIAKPSIKKSQVIKTSINTTSTMEFLRRLPSKIEMIRSKLKTITASHHICVFGANHTASTFLDLTRIFESSEITILDDDIKKAGLTISLARHQVKHPSKFITTSKNFFLVAVAEGRNPELYRRLRQQYPIELGHRVESLKSFVTSSTM